MEAAAVATAFVRHDGEVLAVRRSDDAPTFPGRWAGISSVIEADEDPVVAARRELRKEVDLDAVELVRTGEPLRVEATERVDAPERDEASERAEGTKHDEATEHDAAFEVHPVLFDARGRTVALGPGLQTAEWVPATELLRRETVPRLFESYQQVAPSVQSVAADDEHGAATLSIRALEVLRDRAGLLAVEGETDLDELDYLGDQLRTARPSMAVLRNRINRALSVARSDGVGGDGDEGQPDSAADATPATVERAAIDGINRALAADAEAAMRAAGLVSGWHVLTLSRSKTVLEALQPGTVAEVSIAESRPAREGIDVAETLAGSGGETDTAPSAAASEIDAPITVHTDAAVAHRLASAAVDAVLVGADTVLPDGRVVNKTGTRGAAIAAAHEGVPVYAVAATDKITTREDVNLESGHPAAVYDGDAPLDVANPTFDVTPADAIAGIVTERGVLEPDDISGIVAELRELEPE